MWIDREILEWCIDALRAASEAIELEQAPKGIDSKDEKWVQGELASAIASRMASRVVPQMTVVREQVFPHMRRVGARLSEREKCDLVLLPAGTKRLLDEQKAAGARKKDVSQAALFGDAAGGDELHDVARPEDAYWLEVKVLGQFEYRKGVPVPNRQYSTQLVKAVCDDLQKLVDDPVVRHGGVLVVLFVADEAIAQHDMGVAMSRGIDKGLNPSGAMHGGFAIADRIQNRWCSCWLMPVERM
jgi:hypothetical protein